MSRQIDKKKTKQVRIDKTLHKIVKIEATKQGGTIRELVERYIDEGLNLDEVDFEGE